MLSNYSLVFFILWGFNLVWFQFELQLEISNGQLWSLTQASPLRAIILFPSLSLKYVPPKTKSDLSLWSAGKNAWYVAGTVLKKDIWLVVYTRGGWSSLSNTFKQNRSISMELAQNINLLFTLSLHLHNLTGKCTLKHNNLDSQRYAKSITPCFLKYLLLDR